MGQSPQGLVCRHKTQEGEGKTVRWTVFSLGETLVGGSPSSLEGRMAHVCGSRRGPEKDRRSPPHRPAELGEARCGAVRGAFSFFCCLSSPWRAIFQADMDWDSPELVSTVLEELDVGSLGFLESSNSVLTQLQEALKAAGFGFEEFRKAQALYWLALSPYAEEADFIEKLWAVSLQSRPMRKLVGQRQCRLWDRHRPGGIREDPGHYRQRHGGHRPIPDRTDRRPALLVLVRLRLPGRVVRHFRLLVRKPVWLHRRGNRPPSSPAAA